MKFELISPSELADAILGRADRDAWREKKTGATLCIQSKSGGPGWGGINLSLYFSGHQIDFSASWPTALGNYSVNVSIIYLPAALLFKRSLIQQLVTEALVAYCAAEYPKDFSPYPFNCAVDLSRVTWIYI